MKISVFATWALAACMAVAAQAQQLKVATGGAGNTYSTMFKQAQQACGNDMVLVEQNTPGSMENVNLLVGNQVNGAFVQTDVLHFRGRTEDLGNVKTLVALHPEEVHVLAPAVSRIKEGGFAGVGAKPIVLTTVKDLAQRRVGAVGGSAITAQVIRLQAEIPFEVREYADNKALMGALTAGDIDAALMVGGAPLGAVATLAGDGWKLLPFPEDVVGKLKNVYRPARLNYAPIRQMGINTVATDALFVTREYRTQKFVEALAKFRGCVLENLDELKETTGMHPKWQAVESGNKGKWAYYELPAAAVPSTPTAAAKPTKKP